MLFKILSGQEREGGRTGGTTERTLVSSHQNVPGKERRPWLGAKDGQGWARSQEALASFSLHLLVLGSCTQDQCSPTGFCAQ